MGHNPPRPQGLDRDSVERVADEISKRRKQPWNDLGELADLLHKKAQADKPITITAGTAAFIASHLKTAHAKPTRDEVAHLLCKHDCKAPCYECKGRANEIVRIYGERI